MPLACCAKGSSNNKPPNRQGNIRFLYNNYYAFAPADMTDLRYDIRMSYHCYKE